MLGWNVLEKFCRPSRPNFVFACQPGVITPGNGYVGPSGLKTRLCWLVPRQALILGLALQFSDWFFEQD